MNKESLTNFSEIIKQKQSNTLKICTINLCCIIRKYLSLLLWAFCQTISYQDTVSLNMPNLNVVKLS